MPARWRRESTCGPLVHPLNPFGRVEWVVSLLDEPAGGILRWRRRTDRSRSVWPEEAPSGRAARVAGRERRQPSDARRAAGRAAAAPSAERRRRSTLRFVALSTKRLMVIALGIDTQGRKRLQPD
jgi:hypothetical protein